MASGGRVRGVSSKWTCFFCFLEISGRSMLDMAKLCIGKHVDSQLRYVREDSVCTKRSDVNERCSKHPGFGAISGRGITGTSELHAM